MNQINPNLICINCRSPISKDNNFEQNTNLSNLQKSSTSDNNNPLEVENVNNNVHTNSDATKETNKRSLVSFFRLFII